jgi:hypothetical protein
MMAALTFGFSGRLTLPSSTAPGAAFRGLGAPRSARRPTRHPPMQREASSPEGGAGRAVGEASSVGSARASRRVACRGRGVGRASLHSDPGRITTERREASTSSGHPSCGI